MHEQNPMLGLRGVRLGLVIEGLYEMQVKVMSTARDVDRASDTLVNMG